MQHKHFHGSKIHYFGLETRVTKKPVSRNMIMFGLDYLTKQPAVYVCHTFRPKMKCQ
jgi:hypothetical protein